MDGGAKRRGTSRWVYALVAVLVTPLLPVDVAAAAPGDITTVAGSGVGGVGGDGGPATAAALGRPWGVALGSTGMFISQHTAHRLRRVDPSGTMSTVAGGGIVPMGDGGVATEATLNRPNGVAFDAAGNLLVTDSGNFRVRRVDAADGIITTVAGTGTEGFSGDGGPGTAATFGSSLNGLAFDGSGNLYIVDGANRRVRRLSPGADGLVTGADDEIITTFAGSGASGSSGDGGPATAAALTPRALTFDAAGNAFIEAGDLVRRVDAATGTITRVAGGGSPSDGVGDGLPATQASFSLSTDVAFDAAGNLFVAELAGRRVRRVVPGADGVVTGADDEIVTTVAGTGRTEPVGDGRPATSSFVNPFGLAFDANGNLLVSEIGFPTTRIRKIVTGADGLITGADDEIVATIAGTGSGGFSGDGGPAVEAQLGFPLYMAWRSGNLMVADSTNHRVRKIDAGGFITTAVGGGAGDGLSATASATLLSPRDVAVDGDGNPLIADCGNRSVRRVDLSSGIIDRVAGGGFPADYVGDGGEATAASLRCPAGLHMVASGPDAGALYIADAAAHRVRKVSPSGIITTVAGSGAPGFAGDGGPATAARLKAPTGVALDGAGNLYIADTGNNRVRKVDAAGTITTVAGDGAFAIGLDGVAATRASLAEPTDVAVDGAGNLVIAEAGLHRLRRVSPAGVISSIAGNGIPGFAGDGGPARDALVSLPTGLAFEPGGALVFTDRASHRVRRIEPGDPPPRPTSGCGMVITKSTTLKGDIGPCSGDGIVVAADNVTLNLNGFRVYGSDATGTSAGIEVYARTGVTIKGGGTETQRGTVSGFDAGIALIGGSGHTVQDVVVKDNIGPASVNEAILGDGILIVYSSDNTVRNNLVSNNGIYDGIGIFGIGANRNLVQANVVEKTERLAARGPVGIGITANAFFSEELPREHSLVGNRFISNVVRDNDNSGISNISNVDGVIRGNLVERNGLDRGVVPGNGIGVQNLMLAEPDTHVLVQGNTVVGNGSRRSPLQGNGIVVSSNENRVVGNEVHANYSSGIIILETRVGSLLGKRNEIRDNNAADNTTGGGRSFRIADLSDTNSHFTDEGFQVFDCDANVWFGNVWGTGGHFPDPAVDHDPEGEVLFPEACTADGGHQASSAESSAFGASAAQTHSEEAEFDVAPESSGPPYSRANPPPVAGTTDEG